MPLTNRAARLASGRKHNRNTRRVAEWSVPPRLSENNPVAREHFSVTLKRVLRITLRGFANLIDLFPSGKVRDVGMPVLSPEEAAREAWRNAGRSLFTAVDSHPLSLQKSYTADGWFGTQTGSSPS